MLLIFKGHHAEHFTFAFWKFFAEHRILLIYLGIMNLVTFIVFAIDKANARANRSRITHQVSRVFDLNGSIYN